MQRKIPEITVRKQRYFESLRNYSHVAVQRRNQTLTHRDMNQLERVDNVAMQAGVEAVSELM